MSNININDIIVAEMQKCAPILEACLHGMADVEFTVENGKFWLLHMRKGRCVPLTKLKVAISMFCDEIISADEVIEELSYKDIESVLTRGTLINTEKLALIASGVPASAGVASATIAFSCEEAETFIARQEEFILCRSEVQPSDIPVIKTGYCLGVIATHGGAASHAALVCRYHGLPCVSGFGDIKQITRGLQSCNQITIDGHFGKIYAGTGKIKEDNYKLPEVKMLCELLKLKIKYNAVNSRIAPLVWRLWDVIVLKRRYGGFNNMKRHVSKNSIGYKSFTQPSRGTIADIRTRLVAVENGNLIVEDLIDFLRSHLSAQVQIGKHYLYVRPLLDPMENMDANDAGHYSEPAGSQLTGLEFFNINQYIDFLIDIRSIKIYFSTEFDYYENADDKLFPLNYLDYTNPGGESVIINTYNATGVSVYLNDVLVPVNDLAMVYHVLRRRAYHWRWHKENRVTKNEIVQYLESQAYLNDWHSKLFYLCEEMNLIEDMNPTQTGLSLIGRFENDR
jgi:phosphohistidine swiveling domain-containing protein